MNYKYIFYVNIYNMGINTETSNTSGTHEMKHLFI